MAFLDLPQIMKPEVTSEFGLPYCSIGDSNE